MPRASRRPKPGPYREVPLNAEAPDALDAWAAVRRRQLEGGEERALFVNCKALFVKLQGRPAVDVSQAGVVLEEVEASSMPAPKKFSRRAA